MRYIFSSFMARTHTLTCFREAVAMVRWKSCQPTNPFNEHTATAREARAPMPAWFCAKLRVFRVKVKLGGENIILHAGRRSVCEGIHARAFLRTKRCPKQQHQKPRAAVCLTADCMHSNSAQLPTFLPIPFLFFCSYFFSRSLFRSLVIYFEYYL